MSTEHMEHLEDVARADIAELQRKERTYQGSWKRRGGVGAFMMLARKWDRIECIAEAGSPDAARSAYDIFGLIELNMSGKDGTLLAEIRDLRRYLLLVEAEMVARSVGVPPVAVSQTSHVVTEALAEEVLHPKDVSRHVCGTPKEDSNRHAVPEGPPERDRFSYQREMNHKEWELALPYQQALYRWHGVKKKWIMESKHRDEWERKT